MGRHLPLFLFIIITARYTGGNCETKVTSILPIGGGCNGAVRITIYGEGFSADRFNFGNNLLLGNRVSLVSETRVIPCDVHDNGGTETQVECYSRFMPPDMYHVRLFVDNVSVPKENLCAGPPSYKGCTYQSINIGKTPSVTVITPPAGLADDLMTVGGKFTTDLYKLTNGTGANLKPGMKIIRAYLGDQHCELLQENKLDFYGLRLNPGSPGKYLDYGVMVCLPLGTYVGNQNFSFIIDYLYGRSLPDPRILRLTAENNLTIYQTFAEVIGVSPSSGSVMGGTLLTITGRHFDETDAPIQVKVDEADCAVQLIEDDRILCQVGPQTGIGNKIFPGNRGATRSMWNTTIVESVLAIQMSDITNIMANYEPFEYEHLEAFGWGEPKKVYKYMFHVSNTPTFFIPPSDNKYKFYVMADDFATLNFSDRLDTTEDKLIAWNQSPQTDYVEDNQISDKMKLKKGKPYFLEVRHLQATGNAHLRVGLFMSDTIYTSKQSGLVRNEIQTVETRSKVTAEIQMFSLSGWTLQQGLSEVQKIRVTSPSLYDAIIRFGIYGVFTAPVDLLVRRATLNKILQELPFEIAVSIRTKRASYTERIFTITFTATNRGDWPDFEVIADPSSPVPITYEVTETVKGIPDMENIVLSYDKVPSLPIYGPNVTLADLTAAVAAIFTVRCPTSLTNPVGVKLLQSYEVETPDLLESGERVQDEEPFCGNTSLKNPTFIYSYKTKTPRINPFRYRVLCFAYYGILDNSLLLSYTTSSSKRKGSFPVEWPTSDGWVYHCVDLADIIRSVYPKDGSAVLSMISLVKIGGDLLVDEVYIGTNKPTDDPDFGKFRRLPPRKWIGSEVTVEQKDIQTYQISIHTHKCAYDLPLFKVEHARGNGTSEEMLYSGGKWPDGVEVKITRVQAASPPISGTFSIKYGGRTSIEVVANASSDNLQNILETLPGMGKVKVSSEGECAGYVWTIEWLSMPGNLPLVEVNGENISGYGARMLIGTKQSGGVFFDGIPGDMLRTYHTDPQVTVSVNQIPSHCSGNCSYHWLDSETPIISARTPAQGAAGTTLTIGGSGFDTAMLSNNTVTIGGSLCLVTGLYGSGLVCTVGTHLAGTYDIKVLVNNMGWARYGGNQPVQFTYTFNVTGLSPTTGGLGGGTVITMLGVGFSPSISVTVGNDHCSILSIDPTTLTCTTPAATSDSTVSVTLTESSTIINAPTGFTYDSSLTPIVTEISKTFILVSAPSTVVTVAGYNFGISPSSVVINNQNVSVLQYNDTYIILKLSPQPVGDHQLLISVGTHGYALYSNLALVVITYHLVMTSVSPPYGSVFGGTQLTITGEGFGSDLDVLQVTVGDLDCSPISIQPSEIQCVVAPPGKTHLVTNKGVHPLYGSGYVWEPQVLAIEILDVVHWEWMTPDLLDDISYRIVQTETPTSVKPIGFESGNKTANGTFEWRFKSPGVVYYWTGGPVDDGDILMRGTIYVDRKESYAGVVMVTINGHDAEHRLTLSNNLTDCLTQYTVTSQAEAMATSETYIDIINITATSEDVTASNVTTSNVTASDVTASDITASDVTSSDVTGSDITTSGVTISDVTASESYVTASDVTTSNVTATPEDITVGDATAIYDSTLPSEITSIVTAENVLTTPEYLTMAPPSYSFETTENETDFAYVTATIDTNTTELLYDSFVYDSSTYEVPAYKYETTGVESDTTESFLSTGGINATDELTSTIVTTIEPTTAWYDRPGPVCLVPMPVAEDPTLVNYCFWECNSPTITSIVPRSGTITTAINITGTNFGTDACTRHVTVGNYACDVTTSSETTILCFLDVDDEVKVGVPLEVKLWIESMGPALVAMDIYVNRTFTLLPHITAISPSRGSTGGGTELTLDGVGFVDGYMSVLIAGGLCVTYSVTYTRLKCLTGSAWSGWEIGAYVEASILVGTESIPVECVSSCIYSYTLALTPSVNIVTPLVLNNSSETVNITGHGFSTNETVVTALIGEMECAILSLTDTELLCNAGEPGSGEQLVSVMVWNKGYANVEREYSKVQVLISYNIMDNPASISVWPLEGSIGGGTPITVSGYDFSETTTIVIGNDMCDIIRYTNSTAECVTPPGVEGVVNLMVMWPDHSKTTPYMYAANHTVHMMGLSTTVGSPGDLITIATADVLPNIIMITVKLGHVNCIVMSVVLTDVTCRVGEQIVGEKHVSMEIDGWGHAVGELMFTYRLALSMVAANIGSYGGGHAIVITGAGFEPGLVITICGSICHIIADSITYSECTCTTPHHDGFSIDICDIVATLGSETAQLSGAYTYTLSETPVVNSVSPTSGVSYGGTPLAITGIGFSSGHNILVSIGETDCPIYSIVDENKIFCRTKEHRPSWPADVKVYVESKGFSTMGLPGGVTYHYIDNWTSNFTWEGYRLPEEGDDVTIYSNMTVILDTSTPVLRLVHIQGGKLIFRDMDLELQAEMILITDGGLLQVGTENAPFQHKAIITLHGHPRSDGIPLFGVKCIAVREGTLDLHGAQVYTVWTHLASTIHPGDTNITLMKPVPWSPGDEIVIATTGHRYSQAESERRTIQSVAVDGFSVILDTPVTYEHLGEPVYLIEGRNLLARAEVGLLTHNVVVRGATNLVWSGPVTRCKKDFGPGEYVTGNCYYSRVGEEIGYQQMGAHIMMFATSARQESVIARISYVELTHVGQAYRKNRHPIGFHMSGLMPSSYVWGCSIHRSFSRAVVIHGTHNVTIAHNIVYDIEGNAFHLDDGIEEFNVFKSNLAVHVMPSSKIDNIDLTPSAFSVTNPQNSYIQNCAVGVTHFGFWYHLMTNPSGPSFTPTVYPSRLRMEEFQDNTVHSVGWYGLWFYPEYFPSTDSACKGEDGSCIGETAQFDGFTVWNTEKGVEGWDTGVLQFINFLIVQQEACGVQMHKLRDLQLDYSEKGPLINNSLIVANTSRLANNITREGIILPYGKGLMIANTIFSGFANYSDGVVHTCFSITEIPRLTETNCGGFTYFTTNLKFVNSPNVMTWRWEHEGAFYDLDGSLCGFPECTVIPSNPSQPPGCIPAPANVSINSAVPISICNEKIWFHRFSLSKLSPKPKANSDVTFTGSYGSTVAVYRTLRVTSSLGYMVMLHNNDNYTMTWDYDILINVSYTGLLYGFKGYDYITISQNFSEIPDSFKVLLGDEINATNPLIDGITGDWYFEMYDRLFTFIANAKARVDVTTEKINYMYNPGPIAVDVHKCFFRGCVTPPDPNTVPPIDQRPTYAEYWDVVRSWRKSEEGWGGYYSPVSYGPPLAGDNVKILLETWIIIRTPTPELEQVWIYGGLEFEFSYINSNGDVIAQDYIFSATHIIVAGGRLVVGWPEAPFPGTIQIKLRGNPYTDEIVLEEGPKLGAKALGVFGGLDLHGKTHVHSWTHLSQTTHAGDTSLTLEEPVDWLVGDEFIIAPTGFDLEETEIRTITATNGNTTFMFTEPLLYHHYASYENIGPNMTYLMAAEVGLLTRNIKVIGEAYPNQPLDSFGARVLVGTYYADRLYIGFARLSNVEFYLTGQLGYTDPFDPRFSLTYLETGMVTYIKPSYIESCTFHHGFSPAIGLFGADGIEMSRNIIHHTVGSSVIVEGADARLIDNLIIQVIHPGVYNGRSQQLNVWDAGIWTLDAASVTLHGNVVAGSHRALYRTHGESCDKIGSGAEMWSNNVGHSSLSGIVMLPGEGILPCTLLANFTIHHTHDYGIYTQTEANFKVINYISIDNQLGLFPMVTKPESRRHQYEDKYYEVRESVFVGRSSVYDCADKLSGNNMDFTAVARSWQTVSGGKIGISWPTFSSRDNSAPDRLFYDIRSYQTLRGILLITDVTFTGFRIACGNQSDIIITTNPYNDDLQHPTVMERITLHDVDSQNLAFIHRARIEMINPADCVDMDCDGLRKVLLKDLDGGFLGSPGVLFSESEWEWEGDPARGLGFHRIPAEFLQDEQGNDIDVDTLIKEKGIYRGDDCHYVPSYHAWVCRDLHYEMLQLESTDYDTETRRVSPISLFTKGFIDLVNGPRDHSWCYDDTCRQRLSTFPMILATGKTYEIYFTGIPPRNMRYHWLNTEPTTSVLLATWYPQYTRLNIYVKGELIIPTNGYYNSKNQLALRVPDYPGQYIPDINTDPTGTNYFDRVAQVLYVVLRGPETIDVRTDDVVLVTFNVPYMVIDDTFREQIVSDFATLFDIPEEKVLVSEVITNETMTFIVEIANPPAQKLSEETVLSGASPDGSLSQLDNPLMTTNTGTDPVDSSTGTDPVDSSTGTDPVDSTSDTGTAPVDSTSDTGTLPNNSTDLTSDTQQTNTSTARTVVLSQEMLLAISESVVTSFQLGVLDDILNTTIETMAVDKPPPVLNTTEYQEFLSQDTVEEPVVLVVPKRIVIIREPRVGDEYQPLTVQPQIRTIDGLGNIVQHVGTTENPWIAVVGLEMIESSDTRTVIIGQKEVVFIDGWANFTDLVITHSGTYLMTFNVANTSLPVVKYEVSVGERALDVELISLPSEVYGEGPFGAIILLVYAETREAVKHFEWKEHIWECHSYLYNPNTYLSVNNATLSGDTTVPITVQADLSGFQNLSIKVYNDTPLAIFRNLSLTTLNKYIITFQCATDQSDYNFTFDSQPVMAYPANWEDSVPEVEDLEKVKVNMEFELDQEEYMSLAAEDELYLDVAMHNHLWNLYPNISFTDVNIVIAESSIDFDMSGDGNVTFALYDMWDYLAEPMILMYGHIPITMKQTMLVDGEPFYGYDDPPMVTTEETVMDYTTESDIADDMDIELVEATSKVTIGTIIGIISGICVLCICMAVPATMRQKKALPLDGNSLPPH